MTQRRVKSASGRDTAGRVSKCAYWRSAGCGGNGQEDHAWWIQCGDQRSLDARPQRDWKRCNRSSRSTRTCPCWSWASTPRNNTPSGCSKPAPRLPEQDMAPDELVNAVHRVMLGKKYITASIAGKTRLHTSTRIPAVRPWVIVRQEFSVFKMLASGKSVSEIADSCTSSVNKRGTYRSRIMVKMEHAQQCRSFLYSIEHKLI